MSSLNLFALVVLIVLIAVVVAVWIILAMLPGRIARQRNHPQTEAINVCGWWGAITLGLLLPVAWIWAYTDPSTSGFKQPRLGYEKGKGEEGQP